MSDIERMLRAAAEDPRPLDLDRVQRMGRRRRRRPTLVVLGLVGVVLVVAAVGALVLRDDAPGRHVSTERPANGTARPSPATTAPAPEPPAPRAMAWWVESADGLVVRGGDASGDGFRTVATLPQSAVPLALRADRMMYVLDAHLHGLELPSGRDTDYGGGPEYFFTGGAFSPDGTEFAYVRATQGAAAIRVLELTSGTVRELRRFERDKWDVPRVWTDSAIASVGVYGFSEGTYDVARLDPATGDPTATTDVHWGATIADDGQWAAAVDDVDLGDQPSQSVLPPGPFNTLYLFEIGGERRTVVQQPHHDMSALAVDAGGARVLYHDAPDTGIAADASSPEYGLFLLANGSATRLAPYGDRWSPAVYLDREGRFAVARGDASSATLTVWDGASFRDLDHVDLGDLGPTGSALRAGVAIAAA